MKFLEDTHISGGKSLQYAADIVVCLTKKNVTLNDSIQLRVIKNRTSMNPRLRVKFSPIPQIAYGKDNRMSMWPARFFPGSLITSKKNWMLSGNGKDEQPSLLGNNLGEFGFIVAVNGDGDAHVWFPYINKLVWIALIKHVKLVATSSEKKPTERL